jgi:hypothetical protein
MLQCALLREAIVEVLCLAVMAPCVANLVYLLLLANAIVSSLSKPEDTEFH